ncbi:DUF7853 family protein [Natronococcus jeotgali]|uniref:Uncharacterized protein n=1 Tax=Natronococcus jeotgali DSM 18795 TaxID=1227498 RepID=L9X5V0_9EURY|nr:hypothetical protein [Natronococcus jeotgali]ELY56982.1 hypothetical protein C492_14265 [Natronococcus jeotgali DSM 18795]
MSSRSRPTRSTTLSLSHEERWTLHHVLLHRIEQEETAADATDVDSPSLELFQAFDTIDDGRLRFTEPQLEAVQRTLAAYQRSTGWWELERSEIESLLEHVATALEVDRLPAD